MTSRIVLVAAVLSAVVTGCSRRATAETANAGTAGSGSTMSSVAAATPTPSTTPSAATTTTGTGASAGVPMTAAADSPAAGAGSKAAADTSGASAAGSTAGGAGAMPSDPQIAEIVTTANTGEISAGKMAESKSKNAKVKEFAKNMIDEHTAVNKQVADLAKKTKMKPTESDASKMLKDDVAKTAATLKPMNGTEFDKAYIDSQVAMHEKVLQTIDTMLLPSAKDADLKALVQQVRPSVATHLEHAKTLQTSMK